MYIVLIPDIQYSVRFEIIDENNEYYIVKQNLTHGISVYDRIILDALKYQPNEMIY